MHEARILRRSGLKQWEIARILNISERTVRTYLKEPAKPRRIPPRPSLLDTFKSYINEIIDDTPYYNCVLLFERLKSMGYTGQISILRDYVSIIRKKYLQEAVIRFETEPGLQAQVDWKVIGKRLVDGKIRNLYEFVMLLGFSRRGFVCHTHSMKQSVLHDCHVRAFEYFGGVPREILYDNMKTAFIYDGEKGFCPNKKLLRFAEHYGFVPRRCKVRRPQTKGKVERFIDFLGVNFWPQVDQDNLILQELDEKVINWLEKIDERPLRDFRESRRQRFEREKSCMNPLPSDHYDIREDVGALVSRESLITYAGNKYSVPPENIGKMLTLKVHHRLNTAEVCDGKRSIRTMELLPAGENKKIFFTEDKRALMKLWEKHRRRRMKRERIAGLKKKVEANTDVRSPSEYEKLNWGAA